MSDNPFAERPPWKKRLITVSLTREQDEAFEALKARTRTVTDGAMIKKALEHYIDYVSPQEGVGSGKPDPTEGVGSGKRLSEEEFQRVLDGGTDADKDRLYQHMESNEGDAT